jgi:hypothetical protein
MTAFRLCIVWSFTIFALLLGPSLIAQGMVAAGLPEATTGTANEWGNSFIWAIASSWAMRWMREHPGISKFSERTMLRTQRFIAAAVAFLNGLGISFVFDKEHGTLLISGLFLTAVLHGVRQFFFQEFVYQSALKRSSAEAQAST